MKQVRGHGRATLLPRHQVRLLHPLPRPAASDRPLLVSPRGRALHRRDRRRRMVRHQGEVAVDTPYCPINNT